MQESREMSIFLKKDIGVGIKLQVSVKSDWTPGKPSIRSSGGLSPKFN